jgi:enoyl-[acyl-carrier-protein] reductase (NADH)
VFDTGIWDDETLASRAQSYGLTVDEYKRNNLLGVEVTSDDVARVIVALCSTEFAKTTGAQIPVDGGNERIV